MKCSYTGLGKQTLRGCKQNLVCTRTQEKEAVTLQDTDSDLSVSVQESPEEAWVGSSLLQGWEQSVAVHALDLLKEVTIIFVTSTTDWSQVKQQRGNIAPPKYRKLD